MEIVRLWAFGLFGLIVLLLAGCAPLPGSPAANVRASRDALQACLAVHQDNPSACAAQQEMFDADAQIYAAHAAAHQHTSVHVSGGNPIPPLPTNLLP